MSDAAPKVSVAMVTYRHEPFIAEAIESVLRQRASFAFEFVIGDDCSPDRTGEIVREYAAKYPGRIRAHFSEKNEGLTRNLSRTIGLCRGQYVAWLEGDDFWTSPDKLQRQADYLDANPDCAWCFTRAVVVDQRGQPIETQPVVRVAQPKYTLADYLRRLFQPRACTVMFRHRLFAEFPDWFYEMPTGDMPLHVLNAEHGDIGFIDAEMAAYRIHPGGVWSAGFSPREWRGETEPERRHLARRLENTVTVYQAIALHVGGDHRAIARAQVGRFAYRLAVLYRSFRDWPATRRTLWLALRAAPFDRPVSLAWLLESLAISHFPFLSRSRAKPAT